MMKVLNNLAKKIPDIYLRRLACVPFSFRLFPIYSRTRKDIVAYNQMSQKERKEWIFKRLQTIVGYAFYKNTFYRQFYQKHHFHPDQLKCLDDFNRVPIVTKADLQKFDLEKRSNAVPGRIKMNTGGTSGVPLEFFCDRNSSGREWAHMHQIWAKLNYKTSKSKLTFRGGNFGDTPIYYKAYHNEYYVNAYLPYPTIIDYLSQFLKKRKIRYLHGYPSSIYDFTKYCLKNNPQILKALRTTLQGIFFSSEYPAPVYRNLIEDAYNVPTISWYGHSEMAVLAGEVEKFIYSPFQTYGYCEAVPTVENDHRLIGTSYYNFASPFIRYDTGDLIGKENNGFLLEKFRITNGRIGDFIIDSNGKRISLTALIFGRHHAAFGFARFVQIRQDRIGQASVIVTVGSEQSVSVPNLKNLFDTSNVAIDFSFEIRKDMPIRTLAGKVPLLISPNTK